VDLELLNFTPETLLIALRRATRGRYLYVYQCNAQGVKVDPAVDHQLTNHMTLLQDIAQAVGVDSETLMDVQRQGIAAARDKVQA
jgi:phage portal protein BeeE